MSTTSSRSRQNTAALDPAGWLLFLGMLSVLGMLMALPALTIGTIAYHQTVNRLSPKQHFLLWFIVSLPCAYLLYQFWQHQLNGLFVTELVGYIKAAKGYQLDIEHWPWSALWALTWPVWIQTLAAAPLWTFWLSLTKEVTGNVARDLNRERAAKQRRHEHSQKKAFKKVRPGRTPDAAGDLMLIGVPIQEEEP
jgi:Na+/melibiose symporter-like transporter